MTQSSHNDPTIVPLPIFPEGKDVEYWRNRAVRAEVELYALREALLQPKVKVGWCQRLLNILKVSK